MKTKPLRLAYCSIYTLMLLSLAPGSGQSCEWHDGAGRFGHFHPLMQQHRLPSSPQLIRVSHQKQVAVSSQQPAVLEIDYQVPGRFHQATLNVSASDKIVLQEPTKIALSLSGKLRLYYQASEPGEHNITLHIQAEDGRQPLVKQQRINVKAD
ncbi:hypothetical protein [Bowmanella denitrificans]|uniref:hypothetical protein n=1 Tax=Bowmanella denitrificans TaxID=366582 RepID=UPI0011AF33B8|nr:hypothetical protein [Bowmanella denitrificans]